MFNELIETGAYHKRPIEELFSSVYLVFLLHVSLTQGFETATS